MPLKLPYLPPEAAVALANAIRNDPTEALDPAALSAASGCKTVRTGARLLETARFCGLADEDGVPTESGIRWADPAQRKAETNDILARLCPIEIDFDEHWKYWDIMYLLDEEGEHKPDNRYLARLFSYLIADIECEQALKPDGSPTVDVLVPDGLPSSTVQVVASICNTLPGCTMRRGDETVPEPSVEAAAGDVPAATLAMLRELAGAARRTGTPIIVRIV